MKYIAIFLILLTVVLSNAFIKQDNLDVVFDTNTNLMWQDNTDTKTLKLTWNEAIKYCEQLNLSTYDDWRLPTIEELSTLVVTGKYNPSISNKFVNIINGFYWSSTEVKGRSAAWYIRFDFGRDGSINMTSKNYVRCVRTP